MVAERYVEGQPLEQGVHYAPVLRSTMDPRNAAASALRAYLAGLVFVRAGFDAPDTEFQLNEVHANWPTPSVALNYPAASVVDAQDADMEAHNLVPTMLEATEGEFGQNTVLWKTAEAVTTFQVDFWTNDESTREAIMARLPQAFGLSEVRTGVMVAGSERYYCRPVRLTLLRYRRYDTPDSVYENERRVTARVQAEVDVVHLREVRPLRVQQVLTVTDQPDE